MITLEKGVALNLNKLESPTPKDAFEIGPVVLEKNILKCCQYIFSVS